MKCPSCKSSEGLSITCYPETRVDIDEEGNVIDSEQEGGYEWNGKSRARCSECGWDGKVKKLGD